MTPKNKSSRIFLRALQLDIFLGWPEQERMKKQCVSLDIQLHFSKPPLACTTDNLEDTYCYDTLVQKIKNTLADRHFRLLEYLGQEIYQIIKHIIPTDVDITLCLTKKPAIENLTGGVSFFYGDENCSW